MKPTYKKTEIDDDTFIDYYDIEVDDDEQKELENKQIDCCVAYLDILGFKSMIDSDSHLPVFALRFIKKFIDVFYNSTSGKHGDVESIDEYDDQGLPKATMFSDSIVISQPIKELDYPTFIDLVAQLQYGLFSKGILVRGGISYGKLYHDENYLFGKGLIKAYLLESNYADYPRILVDEDLINTVHKIVDERFEQSWKDYILTDGKRYYLGGRDSDDGDYSKYIRKDFDERMYINYFLKCIEYGFLSFDMDRDYSQLENIIKEDEIARVKEIVEVGLKMTDHRILAKYEWLRKLYNSSMREACMKRGIDGNKKILNSLLIQ